MKAGYIWYEGTKMAFAGARALGAALVVAGMATTGAAFAVPIVEKIQPSDEVKIEEGDSYSFTHNLHLVGSDTITSASLVIVLRDDGGSEDFKVTFGSQAQVEYRSNVASSSSFLFQLNTQSLADLAADGLLDVKIKATDCHNCDDYAFRFFSSTLTAEVTRRVAPQPAPPATVPEPGTLSLLGLGLAGMAALRARRLRKHALDRA